MAGQRAVYVLGRTGETVRIMVDPERTDVEVL
jgi:hypothetical protein